MAPKSHRNAIATISSLRNLWIFLLVVIVFLSNIRFVRSWHVKGHEALGMVAMSGLSTKADRALKNFLHGQDAVDVSYWGHHLSEFYPSFREYHTMFQKGSIESGCEEYNHLACPNQQHGCLVDIIKTIYTKLATSTEGDVSLELHAVTLKDTDLLKLLITLMGDLHQPLSLGFFSDFGGQNISISYRPKDVRIDTNFYSLIERHLLEDDILAPDSRWYGGWTHVKQLGSMYGLLQDKWNEATTLEAKLQLIDAWAMESYKEACGKFYPMLVSLQETHSMAINIRVNLLRFAQNQILKGGGRLAIILEDLFKNRSVPKLRQRTRIDFLLSPVNRQRQTFPSKSGAKSDHMKNFLINIAIGLVLVSFLFLVHRLTKQKAPLSPRKHTTLETEMKRYD